MVNIPRVHLTAVLIAVVLVAVLVAGCTLNVPSSSDSVARTPVTTVITTVPAGTAAQNTTAGPVESASTAAVATTTAGAATTTGEPTFPPAGTTAPVPADTTGATQTSTAVQSTASASEKGASTVATAGTARTIAPGLTGATAVPTPTTCPADFSGSPRSGPAPLTVTFTALNPCTVWQHMWGFGDGSEIQTVDGHIATVTHTYTSPGTYTVQVIDDDGRLEDGESKTNYITVTAPGVTTTPTVCAADFTGSPRSGPAPLTVTFTALNPCTVWQHIWNFGDGTLFDGSDDLEIDGHTATVTHTFTSPGTYTVHLREDDGRLEYGDSKTDYITVTAPGVTATPGLLKNPTARVTPGLILTTTTVAKPSTVVTLVKNPITQATSGLILRPTTAVKP